MSTIERALIQAYRETDYIVHVCPPAILRINQPNAVLAALHRSYGVEASAFLTAYNPFSQQCADAENVARQRQLIDRIKQAGFSFIEGVGKHPSNQWPGESSILVLRASLEQAKALGSAFEQNAIVWAGLDAVPQLILLQ
jgi:hypothetical protein